jgi:glucokinase
MSVKEKILSYPYDKDIDLITTKDIARAASMGDETALRIFEISGEYLGRGLSILIDILNPERIVIGSVYARAIKFIEPACRRIIELEALLPAAKVCEIVPAALGDEVGEYACLCVAIEGLRLDTTLEE